MKMNNNSLTHIEKKHGEIIQEGVSDVIKWEPGKISEKSASFLRVQDKLISVSDNREQSSRAIQKFIDELESNSRWISPSHTFEGKTLFVEHSAEYLDRQDALGNMIKMGKSYYQFSDKYNKYFCFSVNVGVVKKATTIEKLREQESIKANKTQSKKEVQKKAGSKAREGKK